MCVCGSSRGYVGGGGGKVLGIAAAAEARAVLFSDSIQLTPPLYLSLTGWTVQLSRIATSWMSEKSYEFHLNGYVLFLFSDGVVGY
jgi:hypothetical protein